MSCLLLQKIWLTARCSRLGLKTIRQKNKDNRLWLLKALRFKDLAFEIIFFALHVTTNTLRLTINNSRDDVYRAL